MKAESGKKRSELDLLRRTIESRLGVFLLCLLFTLLMLYRFIIPLGALPFAEGIKGQDCGQMVWNLWVVNEAITHGHNPYMTDLVYYPQGARLAYHSLAAGFFPVTLLVKIFSGGSAMYPLYAYRLIIWLSFTLTLYFSYQLLRRLGLSRWSSAIPAIAYAFCDYFIFHIVHLNHLAGFFIPLVALLLVRLYQQPTTTNAYLLAFLSAYAIYFTELSLYIYTGACFFLFLMLLAPEERARLAEKFRRIGLHKALLALFIFLFTVAPFIYNLARASAIKPKPEESSYYSANLAAFLIPNREETPLYGALFAPLNERITEGMGEPGVFAGFPLLIFALVALFAPRQKLLRFAALLSLLFFILSLGPTLKIFGTDTRLPLPYALLMRVPPFDAGRTPVRFVVMAIFFLMIVAASGISWTERFLKRRGDARLSAALMSLLLLWTISESYTPTPRAKTFVPPQGLQRITAGPVLNLPLMRNDGYAALLQVFHHQPIATGYLARYNAEQWAQFEQLQKLFNKGGATFCDRLRQTGFRNLLIAPRSAAPAAPSVVPLDLEKCSINTIDLRREEQSSLTSNNVAIKDEIERPATFPHYTPGTRVDLRTEEADKYLWYGWSGREPANRWTERNRAAIIFSLAEIKDSALLIKLNPFLASAKLEEQRVEIKLNDQPITTLSLKETEPKEYSIALPSSFLRRDNILTFDLPDAASPQDLKISEDARLLGINVEWFEIKERL